MHVHCYQENPFIFIGNACTQNNVTFPNLMGSIWHNTIFCFPGPELMATTAPTTSVQEAENILLGPHGKLFRGLLHSYHLLITMTFRILIECIHYSNLEDCTFIGIFAFCPSALQMNLAKIVIYSVNN